MNLCVEKHIFDDGKVFYGDEIFKELGFYKEWNKLKNEITNFNINLKKENYIFKVIDDYLKEKYDEKKYDEIVKG